MCGLAGVLTDSSDLDGHLLAAANAALRHRGPDDEGVWISGDRNCGLGHVRLSIIDVEGGRQPLSSPDGAVHAVVNGEFYGFEAIRESFQRCGYAFHTRSDSEILIPLYLKYGERCFEHLRGEFAFILRDERRNRLLIARDRFGIKPLFYAEHQGRFYVASEIKALIAMGVPARWDPDTVLDDEWGLRDAEGTLFHGVRSVPPGYCLVIENGRVTRQRYWDFDYPRREALRPEKSEREYQAELWSLLDEAVRLRLRADVPVGMYLSGGIDSSVVLSLMRQHTSDNLDAFTLSFDHERFDEGDIARETAAHLGVRHTVIDIDAAKLAANLEDTVWHNECPFNNSNSIAKYILSRHVRDAGLKVVLTGEGSDEVLGGYVFFMGDMRAFNSRAPGPVAARTLRRLKRSLRAFGRTRREDTADEARFAHVVRKLGFVPHRLRFQGALAARFAALRSDCFAGRGDFVPFASLMSALDDSQLAGRDPLNQSLYLCSKSMLPNLILTTLGDRVEMAHSVEARLPFLDTEVVRFLTRLPVEHKIRVRLRGGVEKYLLKQAARAHVTERLYRRTKYAFAAPPALGTRRNPLADMIGDILHGSAMRDLRFYDQRKVLELYDRTLAGGGGAGDGVLLRIAGLAVMQQRFGLTM